MGHQYSTISFRAAHLEFHYVTHSHLPIDHLLKQIQTYSVNRESRDVRPEWVTQIIGQVAELFEPLTGIGRVGFDCQLSEDSWVVGLYLGCTEIVGGKHDGQSRRVNFEFDLSRLMSRFDQVSEFYWSAFPTPADDEGSAARSFVTIAGQVAGQGLRLQIFSVPPDGAGPGLRQYPNGNFEPF